MFEITLPVIFTSIALLLVRLVLVVTFSYEAWFKLRDIKTFAKNDSLPVPVAYGVAAAEIAAVIAMLTGFMAQWAGVGVIILMTITIGLHILKWHSPYWASKKGWEYDLLMLVLAVIIVVFGPGTFVIFS